MSIQFTDICFITKDVLRLRAFYEAVFGGKSEGSKTHSTLAINGLNFVFLEEKTKAFYYEYPKFPKFYIEESPRQGKLKSPENSLLFLSIFCKKRRIA